jgi:arginyl-tRNA synthetase
MVREKIAKLIQKSIKELQKEKIFPEFWKGPLAGWSPEIKIEHPEEKIYGDYSTNIALILAKALKKEPMEIGESLKSQILKFKTELFEKVEVVKPGFINFFLKKEFLQKKLGEIFKEGEKFGKLKIGKNQKVQVEFISANPTGPLHIGNGRGAFFGDSLANILKMAGYKVEREYYINDGKVNTQIRILGQTALGRGTTYLTEELKTQISKLKTKLKKIKDEGEAGYLLAQEVQKKNRDFIERKLKIKFDNWISEENLYKEGKVKKIYQWLKKKGLVYEKEGAEWLKISKFGAPKDEVIVRSDGNPTYFLSDIAYHKDKFDRGFKKIINIWGADHQGHIPKIKAVAKILGYKGDLDILISQMVRLKGGMKLSKRKGQIITLEELVDEVGLDVARFFYLAKSLNTQMEFDLDLAKEQSQKNPVYYIQYAHTRICGILRKSKVKSQNSKVNYRLLNHPSELELIKQLIKFPEIVEDCAKNYQLQRIPQYALDLATSFHQFYRDCRVLTENENLKKTRLALILATKIVLKNTLSLMGISAPEKM